MSGEPTASALSEAQLVATTCEKVSTEEVDATLKEMRAAVDRSFDTWVKGQPACWEQMREEWRERQEQQRQLQQQWSQGGLHLSGVGEGGGGYGSGIGLGSIGTIGHGAGTGTGMGYGNGHGALPQKAKEFSGTNNQVAGVDEADIVKTDGQYVYLASSGALRIVEALKPKILSTTAISGTVRELFVEGDRAVVYSSAGLAIGHSCTYGYDCVFQGDGTTTTISVFDIHNRLEPKLTRRIDLSGSLMAARRIGDAVHTVVADNDSPRPRYVTWPPRMPMCGTEQAAVNAKFAQLRKDNEKSIRASTTRFPSLTENGKTTTMCGGLMRTGLRDGSAFTSVVSFDMAHDDVPATTATMQSRPGAVFASDTGLYVSVTHQKPAAAGGRWYSYYASAVDEVSEIHKFRIGASPKQTKYVGSGTIPGHVLNQFAMDEWFGYLRVATTKGRVPDPKVESAISIVSETAGGSLSRIGAISGIAPGEDIRAVRFDNERGYVVTFKKTDPLFVIDTLEPQRPKILGELKIPGFSTYIHRIDAEHLLSIGFDANDHGSFAYFDGVILQLFDVKNPTDPKLMHKEKIGTRGSSSEAATNHLAFNYVPSRGLLAIPMTICEGGSDGRNGDTLAFSGLLVYDVDLDRGFTRLGGVDHGTKGANCGTWWSNATSQVKRSVVLDQLVYSIADDRVKVQSLEHLGVDVADLALR
jgi:hypothetical protein